jgi:hypothetical protein
MHWRNRHTGRGISDLRVFSELSDSATDIEEIVNRETRAWDTQDVDLLTTVFHPDEDGVEFHCGLAARARSTPGWAVSGR